MFNYAHNPRLTMTRQLTSSLMMVRPASFMLNTQTAVNNYYQKAIAGLTPGRAQEQALAEFDAFAQKLEENDIEVIMVQDTPDPETPDAIFPNNWVSFHHDGSLALYPMYAPNRRQERRADINDILAGYGFDITRVVDFTHFEKKNKFLEGTGSMILDRDNHIVYAALSERTHPEVLQAFCEEFSYTPVTFRALQTVGNERLPIYHTNVMMCLTDKLAVVCLDSIDDEGERQELVASLEKTGKTIVPISEEQVNHFAGNMLGVKSRSGEACMIMSQAALDSLTPTQKATIAADYRIIASPLTTIEALGGGSARCMLAEIFLPKK